EETLDVAHVAHATPQARVGPLREDVLQVAVGGDQEGMDLRRRRGGLRHWDPLHKTAWFDATRIDAGRGTSPPDAPASVSKPVFFREDGFLGWARPRRMAGTAVAGRSLQKPVFSEENGFRDGLSIFEVGMPGDADHPLGGLLQAPG